MAGRSRSCTRYTRIVAFDDETSQRPVKIHRRPPHAEPRLRVELGLRKGEKHWLREPKTLVGRDKHAPLCFTDRGVSRRHAEFLRASDGLVSLLDLGSTNGTYVNGSPIELVALRDGDRIQVGPELVLRFAYEIPKRKSLAALPLTTRQLEVARLVANGLTSSEIAEKLGIRTRTITSHLDHIYERLEINSRAALTRLIVEADLVDPE